MRRTKQLTILSLVVLFSLLSSLIVPINVLADDGTPPPAETAEVAPPTEEPIASAEPVAIEATPVIVEPTEAPVVTEPVSTEPLPLEASPTALAGTEIPATEEPSAVADTLEMDLSAVVESVAENNLVLSDPSGEPLGFGTVAAAEALTNGDPYFTSGGILYSFTFADCDPLTSGDQPCSTPIQAALTFSETHIPDLLVAPDGTLRRTIYVEPATYYEKLTINTQDLTLWGNPGSLTEAGAAANAPVLDGSLWASGDTGVTINLPD